MHNSKVKQAQTIQEIDRIRKVDVPWKLYLGIFAVAMLLLVVISYFLLFSIRLPLFQVLLALIFFFLSSVVALVAITYFGFKQEEITDSIKLAGLYNKIKDERIAQLNHTRMSLKLKAMNQGRAKTDIDRQFLRNYNMLRI